MKSKRSLTAEKPHAAPNELYSFEVGTAYGHWRTTVNPNITIQKIIGIGVAASICAVAIALPVPSISTQGGQQVHANITAEGTHANAELSQKDNPNQTDNPNRNEQQSTQLAQGSATLANNVIVDEQASEDQLFEENVIWEDNTPAIPVAPPADYEKGEVAEYEGWYKIAIPKGFTYDSSSNAFYNNDETDSFLFNVIAYCPADGFNYDENDERIITGPETYETSIEYEMNSAQEVYEGDPTVSIERKTIVCGTREWTAVITRQFYEDSAEAIVMSTLLTDLGNGYYASALTYQEPDTNWLRTMLETFEPLPGDPYENYMKYLDSLGVFDSSEEAEEELSQ